jgi:DNA-binding response OmpR family regulator
MDLRKRILIVEDDEDIALSLKYNLEKEGGYLVQTEADGEGGLRAASQRTPDLVLLDLNLPGLDGLSVCKQLRREPATAGVPIVMLTARVEETDRIVGLELGADDYITKPFSMKEILARARAVLRRTGRTPAGPEGYTDGVLRVEPSSRTVTVRGAVVPLTRKEFNLLVALIEARGRVLSRDQLLERVWGHAFYGETRTVDVHVRRLRQKLGAELHDSIATVIGVGYRFHARNS